MLAQLRHRNIVRVFEDGLHGSEYYIVSRLVDARPLSVVLVEGRVPPRQAASWVRDVAEALAYAHRERILHRDVKPANILITSRLEALLADFGLALDVYELNQASAVYGTPAYMAPEQIEGDPTRIGPHSDQYSLAVVLHELLTGRRPFHDPVPGQPRIQPPAPGQMGPGVDRRLEAICLTALSPSPVDRYPNLGAMADDLDRWLSGKKPKAKPRRLPLTRALKRHAAFLTAAAVALALAILLVAQWRFATLTIARLGQDRLRVDGELNAKVGELDQKTREFEAKRAEHAAQFENERASFRQPLARLHLKQAETFAAAGDFLNACVHLAAALDQGEQSWDEKEKQRVRGELAVLAGRLIPVSHRSMWPRFGGPVPRVVVPETSAWLGIESDHPTRRWPARSSRHGTGGFTPKPRPGCLSEGRVCVSPSREHLAFRGRLSAGARAARALRLQRRRFQARWPRRPRRLRKQHASFLGCDDGKAVRRSRPTPASCDGGRVRTGRQVRPGRRSRPGSAAHRSSHGLGRRRATPARSAGGTVVVPAR